MSNKGLQIIKEVKFVEYCRIDHVCTFCADPIPTNSSYFTFHKYMQEPNNKRIYLEKSPYKCCFKCYPEFHHAFREEKKPAVQLTLGVV